MASEEILRVYDWRHDEFMLIDWYNALVTSGDHYLTFSPDLRYMSNFLNFFKPPRTLAYALDSKGMTFAFWLEPALSGAFFGVWIRSDKRHAPSSMRLLQLAMDESFKAAAALMATTKQETVAAMLEKMGATHHSPDIPALWDGESVSLYSITKDKWERRYERTRR